MALVIPKYRRRFSTLLKFGHYAGLQLALAVLRDIRWFFEAYDAGEFAKQQPELIRTADEINSKLQRVKKLGRVAFGPKCINARVGQTKDHFETLSMSIKNHRFFPQGGKWTEALAVSLFLNEGNFVAA